jgi:hypothetical protein
MPIDFTIDHDRRLVLARAHGVVRAEELFAYQRAAWSDPAVAGYDELVDTTEVIEFERPSASGMRGLAAMSAAMDQPGSSARFAIVASDDLAFGLGRMYQTHRALQPESRRQMSVFRTREEAMAWLARKPGRD